MQQKIIISFIACLFLVSSIFLFLVSDKNMDLDYKKDWWVVYFENPADNSLDFKIENHSNKDNFSWEVLVSNQKRQGGNIVIQKGNSWMSDIQIDDCNGKRVMIRVSDGENKKEIYKNL